jgi:hypothetical protein
MGSQKLLACAFCTVLTIRKTKRRNKMSFAGKE